MVILLGEIHSFRKVTLSLDLKLKYVVHVKFSLAFAFVAITGEPLELLSVHRSVATAC